MKLSDGAVPLGIRTNGSTRKWPWKGCKEKLAILGYRVQLALNSKSQASDLMQESNQLTPAQARDILSDIVENNIRIVVTEVGPTRSSKRKRIDPAEDTLHDNTSRGDKTPTATNHTNAPPNMASDNNSHNNSPDNTPTTHSTEHTRLIDDALET